MVPSWKIEASGAFGADRLYFAWAILLEVPSADRCSLVNSGPHMGPPSRVYSEITDSSPVLLSVFDVHNVHLDA